MGEITGVDLYWRPGCPSCVRLRGDLRRAGLPLREVDIWSTQWAASDVRSVAGGDETVPTVTVGAQSMVNPSARQVLATLAATAPHLLPARPRRARPLGAGYPLLAAVAWLLLAAWRPGTTTFHLAPAVVTAAWAVAERLTTATGLARTRAAVAVAGGAVVALAAAGLRATGRLAGPALAGSPLLEDVLVVPAGAVVTWWTVTRGRPGSGPGEAPDRQSTAVAGETDGR